MCDNFSQTNKNIGVWISDKKSQKLNWNELIKTCNAHGYKLIKLDLEQPLEDQEKIDVFLHKLTDILAAAGQCDPRASNIIAQVEQYLSNHPNIIVIDPINRVKILLNRYNYYTILDSESIFMKNGIFTPTFAEFTTNNMEINSEIMIQRGVHFPVICKHTVAHGSKLAHEMIVIFNKKGLNVCKPPCVVQSFVNHNAILHKVFVVGNKYHICERPSLKNFYPSEELEPIFYSTGEVCKADSQSTLSILDPHDQSDFKLTLDEEKVKHIIRVLKKEIGLLLFGFDVVIDNLTSNHAVIDINVYPSYDNFPCFFEHLLDCIDNAVHRKMLCDKSTYSGINHDDFCMNHRINGLVNVGLSTNKCRVKGMNIN